MMSEGAVVGYHSNGLNKKRRKTSHTWFSQTIPSWRSGEGQVKVRSQHLTRGWKV